MEEFVAQLSAAMTRHAKTGPIENPSQLSGGASQEMWRFSADDNGSSRDFVLRRRHGGVEDDGGLSGTAITMRAEAELIAAVEAKNVPVPRVRAILDKQDGLGAGYVMEALEGETIARKILRDEEFAAARPLLAEQCGAAMAGIHDVAISSLDGLRPLPALEQLAMYREIYDAIDDPHPVFELAFVWLEDNAPKVDDLKLVHGDFRNGNLMIGAEGLRGVLDWELAHLGDPMEDLGWLCVTSWRFGEIDKPVGGFGTLDQLFKGYEDAGGTPVDPARVHYWEVFGTMKWGVICMMQMSAHITGATKSVERAAIGRRASETEIDLLSLLAA
ncbi:MAG: phosphotransferase family protein [Alphaproteobacteria bacterium]